MLIYFHSKYLAAKFFGNSAELYCGGFPLFFLPPGVSNWLITITASSHFNRISISLKYSFSSSFSEPPSLTYKSRNAYKGNKNMFNPFVPNALSLPPEGVEKGCIENEWVKLIIKVPK